MLCWLLKKRMPKNRRDVARLISQAERLIDHLEFDRATACYQKALKLDPSSALALEGLGEHLLAMGNVERAKELLLKAIQLAPEIGASKYFNMAQIVDGEEALSYHRRGIEVVAADLALVKSGQVILNKYTCSTNIKLCSESWQS